MPCGQCQDRTLGKFPPIYGPHLCEILMSRAFCSTVCRHNKVMYFIWTCHRLDSTCYIHIHSPLCQQSNYPDLTSFVEKDALRIPDSYDAKIAKRLGHVWLIISTESIFYNMFNCDKVKNNEVQGYSFFTPMSCSGAIFFALAPLSTMYC